MSKMIRWELSSLNHKELFDFKPILDSWFKDKLLDEYMTAQRLYPPPDYELDKMLQILQTRLWAIYYFHRTYGVKIWESELFQPRYLSWQILNCQPTGSVWTNPKPDKYTITGKHCRHWTCPWCYLRLTRAYLKALTSVDVVDFPEQGPKSGWNLGSKLNALVFEQPAGWNNICEEISVFYANCQKAVSQTWTADSKESGLPGAEFSKGVRFFSLLLEDTPPRIQPVAQPKLTLRMTFLHTAPNAHLEPELSNLEIPIAKIRRFTNLKPIKALELANPYPLELRNLPVFSIAYLCAALHRRRKLGTVTLTPHQPTKGK